MRENDASGASHPMRAGIISLSKYLSKHNDVQVNCGHPSAGTMSSTNLNRVPSVKAHPYKSTSLIAFNPQYIIINYKTTIYYFDLKSRNI
jgi:4-alpha-glucanotransferase